MQEIAVRWREKYTAEPIPTDYTGIKCLLYDSLGPSNSAGDEVFLLARGQGGQPFSVHLAKCMSVAAIYKIAMIFEAKWRGMLEKRDDRHSNMS